MSHNKTLSRQRKIPPQYYYRAIRQEGFVVNKYVGPTQDPIVALMHREQQLHQATQRAHRRQSDEETQRYTDIDHRICQCCLQWQLLLESWREARGYRKCEDGVWRHRQRKKRKPVMKLPDLKLLIKQAEDGDKEALRQLRLMMDADRDTWQSFGDLSEYVTRQFLDLIAGKNVVVRESLTRKLAQMKQELCQGCSSPTRTLAVEQVLISWLDMHYQQLLFTEPRPGKTETDFLESRLNRARKRYSEALETLVRVKAVEEGEGQ